MPKSLTSLLLLGTLLVPPVAPALAQSSTPPPGHAWARVQALTANTSLHIKASTHNAHCRLKTVDADTLTCVVGDGARTEVYQRADIASIKVPHRGRSTVSGLAIGAGVGIVIGATERNNDPTISRGALAASGAFVFGAIGAIVGALTDFTQTTVYRP